MSVIRFCHVYGKFPTRRCTWKLLVVLELYLIFFQKIQWPAYESIAVVTRKYSLGVNYLMILSKNSLEWNLWYVSKNYLEWYMWSNIKFIEINYLATSIILWIFWFSELFWVAGQIDLLLYTQIFKMAEQKLLSAWLMLKATFYDCDVFT